MAKVEFALPDVGEGLEEGEIISWLVAPGDTVIRDQPLVEVQTDKALVELPSPVAGQVVSLAFAPGDVVKVGQVLVVLDDSPAGDTAPSAVAPQAATPSSTSPAASPGVSAAAASSRRLEAPATASPARPGGTTAGSGGAGRPKAAPAVRKLALERGVDLATVAGTGPGGRIVATDVEAAAAQSAPTGVPQFQEPELRNAGSGAAAARAAADGGIGWMEPGRHPLRGIRRATAETMARSWAEIPHMTTMDEVDGTGLLAVRQRLAQAGIDATIGALFVAAVARGLRRYPVLNASLETGHGPEGGGGAIIVHEDCNVGLAVATADGLVVPVIRQADRRGLAEIGAEVRRLTAAARNRRVDLADLRGGTFTITNYGSLGGRFATPLIRPPEVGIMGFGSIRPRPLAVDEEVRPRPTLPWCLSVDHRLIDGDVATAFAEYVTGLLADPVALLAELLAGA